MNLYIAKSSVEKTILFIPVIVKYIEKNLFIMKPYYSEQILPLSWHLIMLRFHCSMRYEGTVFALQMARPSWGLDEHKKKPVPSEKEIKMFSSIVVLSCKIQ